LKSTIYSVYLPEVPCGNEQTVSPDYCTGGAMSGFQAARAGRASMARWPRAALRIGFGLIWLIDATMKWLPGFSATYRDSIAGWGVGQPGWLRPWFRFWAGLQRPNGGREEPRKHASARRGRVPARDVVAGTPVERTAMGHRCC
jgi:hypothetical protein